MTVDISAMEGVARVPREFCVGCEHQEGHVVTDSLGRDVRKEPLRMQRRRVTRTLHRRVIECLKSPRLTLINGAVSGG